MPLEHTEKIHRERDEHLGIFEKQPKYQQFCDRENHQPNHQLYKVNLVINMLVELLIRVTVNILRIN